MQLLPSLVLAVLASTIPAGASPDPIEAHRWTSRLLVVVAPTSSDPLLAEQVRVFETARAGAERRDLVLVRAVGDGPDAVAIRRRFRVPAGAFRAILVGKDGGPKLTESEPIGMDRLFGTIDEMPMRREELKGGRS